MAEMTVAIGLLRGVNVGGNRKIKMEVLRGLCESLKLCDPQTYIQSGNVVFRVKPRDLPGISKRIEAEIERTHGFRPDTVIRTVAEMRSVIARNPFANRPGVEPAELLITFLAAAPSAEAVDNLRKLKIEPEELHVDGSQLYIYFPEGMGRSKLQMAMVERALKVSGTGRNWNTTTKLLAMAEALEASK